MTILIIHIADSGVYGPEFSSGNNHPNQWPLLSPYNKKYVEKTIKIII